MPPRKPKQEEAPPPGDPEDQDGHEVELDAGDDKPKVKVRWPARRSNAGRPPKYKPEFAAAAGVMLRRGATIGELAEAFGVSNRTIHLWQNQHPEFLQQFMNLSEANDARVQRALVDIASGYTVDDVQILNFKGVPVIVPYRKHVPPSFAAIKHYLSVRMPEWKVKDEIEMSGDEAFAEIFRNLGRKPPEQQS
jgi:hypothetical protein